MVVSGIYVLGITYYRRRRVAEGEPEWQWRRRRRGSRRIAPIEFRKRKEAKGVAKGRIANPDLRSLVLGPEVSVVVVKKGWRRRVLFVKKNFTAKRKKRRERESASCLGFCFWWSVDEEREWFIGTCLRCAPRWLPPTRVVAKNSQVIIAISLCAW